MSLRNLHCHHQKSCRPSDCTQKHSSTSQAEEADFDASVEIPGMLLHRKSAVHQAEAGRQVRLLTSMLHGNL